MTDVNKLYELALGHVSSKAVSLAVKLKIDEYLTEQFVSVNELSERMGLNPAVFYRFIRLLDAYDILELDEDRVRANKNTCELAALRTPHILDAYRAIDELEYTLTSGEPCWEKAYGKPFYPYILDHEDKLQAFTDWCNNSAEQWLPGIFSMYDFSQFKTVVDVGGGQGHLLANLLEQNPHQRGVLLDQPEVVKQAVSVFEDKACIDRAELMGGDFFQSVPEGGDLYIICRTLLNWSDEKAVDILNKAAEAMAPDATLLVIDFIVPDKSHPHYQRTLLSDLSLAAIFKSSNRTVQEWESLIESSSLTLKKTILSDLTIKPEPIVPIIILECKKDSV